MSSYTISDFIKIFEQKNEKSIYKSIESTIESKIGKVGDKEIKSWYKSWPIMKDLLKQANLPSDAQIHIEHFIPQTYKRIDFTITGKDNLGNDVAILIEIKGWDKKYLDNEKIVIVEDTEENNQEDSIKENNPRRVHPSFQVFSYSEILNNYNHAVRDKHIKIIPLVYMYNYVKPSSESDPFYVASKSKYVDKAKIFYKDDSRDLINAIKSIIKKGDHEGKIITAIDNASMFPSKDFQHTLESMLENNPDYTLLGKQICIFNDITLRVKNIFKNNDKGVFIIKGGPGTGKSLLAIYLYNYFLKQNYTCKYYTPNRDPIRTYTFYVKDYKSETRTKFAFNSTISKGKDMSVIKIVDEAHLLSNTNTRVTGKRTYDPQLDNIIKHSRISIFLVDEKQSVSPYNIDFDSEIKKYIKQDENELSDKILIQSYLYTLNQQLRCNVPKEYIDWLDTILYSNKQPKKIKFDKNYIFKVLTNESNKSPKELLENLWEKIADKKPRIIAGICWPSNSYIVIPKDKKAGIEQYKIKWNKDYKILNSNLCWKTDSDSHARECAGCIYSSQGLEFDYTLVIIGKDLQYNKEHNCIKTVAEEHAKDDSKLKEELKKDKPNVDEYIRNIYRVLLTRARKGCYVYCVDEALGKYLSSLVENNSYTQK